MKTFIIAGLFGLLFPIMAVAQCYEVQQRPYYPDPYNGGIQTGIANDDIHSNVIDIGFPFCFFGDTVTQLVVASNGYLTFDLSQANQFSPWSIGDSIPNPGLPLFSIMAPYQDIMPSASGNIRYSTYGVAPYRRFVVSYDSIPMFSCTEMAFSNQVVLYESLNVIDMNIDNKPLCETWNGGVAIEGIQNQNGIDAYPVPGRNYPVQWAAQYDSYRFTPICDCPTDSLPDMSLVPGKVYWDQNGDCEYNETEPLVPHVRIDIQPGNGIVWANQNGEFAFLIEPGNYTMQHGTDNPWYLFNTCQPNGIPVTVVADSNALDVCFGDSIVPFTDLNVNVGGLALTSCNESFQLIEVCNNGTDTAFNALLSVTVPSFLVDIQTDLTYISDTAWTMNIDTLLPGGCAQTSIVDSVPCATNLSGEVGCFTASVTLLPSESDTTNNEASFCRVVGVSFDPNDKRVMSQIPDQGWLTQEYIDENDELTYMIRFQNTGTGPAYNVIVRDQLSTFLDFQSIEPIMASHDYYMQMMNGELIFNFLGIRLPDSSSDPIGSQGFVMFRIRQNPDNQPGTVIENQAEIIFDVNAPVLTNITENEIPMIVNVEDPQAENIRVYPNPTNNRIFLSNSDPNNPIEHIYLTDVQGKVLFSRSERGISEIDLSNLSSGVYLLRIQTEQGIRVARVIRN